jgi:hypothetical protein
MPRPDIAQPQFVIEDGNFKLPDTSSDEFLGSLPPAQQQAVEKYMREKPGITPQAAFDALRQEATIEDIGDRGSNYPTTKPRHR